MGPKEYQGKPFSEMDGEEKAKYANHVRKIQNYFSQGVNKGDNLGPALTNAIKYQMLYYPDGTMVTEKDKNRILLSDAELSDIVFVVHDVFSGEDKTYPLIVTKENAEETDTEKENTEKENTEKENTEKKIVEKVKVVLSQKLSPADITLRAHMRLKKQLKNRMLGNELEQNLEKAIRLGCVKNIDESIPQLKDVKQIAAIPELLNELVFSFYDDPENPEQKNQYNLARYQFAVSLDTSQPLKEEDLAKMREKSKEQRKPINLIKQLAKNPNVPVNNAIKGMNPLMVPGGDWYLRELQRQGAVKSLNGHTYIHLQPENKVYQVGSDKPMTQEEFLAFHQIKEPQKPNKWGFFEGVREFWHKHIHNLDDYTIYDRQQKVFETSRYLTSKAGGFDPGEKPKSMDEYEQRQQWLDKFMQREMDEDTKRYFDDLREALNRYPDIGEKLMKEFPNDNEQKLDKSYKELAFGAQPYAFLKDAGDFSKKRLGNLSVLAIAAQSDLFSKETKELIGKAGKDVNKSFGYVENNKTYVSDGQMKEMHVFSKEETEAAAEKIRKTCERKGLYDCDMLVNIFKEAANMETPLGASIRENVPKLKKDTLSTIQHEYAAARLKDKDMKISETTTFANVCRNYLPERDQKTVDEMYRDEKAPYDEFKKRIFDKDISEEEKKQLVEDWRSGKFKEDFMLQKNQNPNPQSIFSKLTSEERHAVAKANTENVNAHETIKNGEKSKESGMESPKTQNSAKDTIAKTDGQRPVNETTNGKTQPQSVRINS